MNKRGAGVGFCFIAACLFSAKYISAAIFGSGISTWSHELYRSMLFYVGKGLDNTSILALIVGIIYIFIAEIEDMKSKDSTVVNYLDNRD